MVDKETQRAKLSDIGTHKISRPNFVRLLFGYKTTDSYFVSMLAVIRAVLLFILLLITIMSLSLIFILGTDNLLNFDWYSAYQDIMTENS